MGTWDATRAAASSGDSRGAAVNAGAVGGAALGETYGGPAGAALGKTAGGFAAGRLYDAISDILGGGDDDSTGPRAWCENGPDCTHEAPEFWLAEGALRGVDELEIRAAIEAANADLAKADAWNERQFGSNYHSTWDWPVENMRAGTQRRLEQAKLIRAVVETYPTASEQQFRSLSRDTETSAQNSRFVLYGLGAVAILGVAAFFVWPKLKAKRYV